MVPSLRCSLTRASPQTLTVIFRAVNVFFPLFLVSLWYKPNPLLDQARPLKIPSPLAQLEREGKDYLDLVRLVFRAYFDRMIRRTTVIRYTSRQCLNFPNEEGMFRFPSGTPLPLFDDVESLNSLQRPDRRVPPVFLYRTAEGRKYRVSSLMNLFLGSSLCGLSNRGPQVFDPATLLSSG